MENHAGASRRHLVIPWAEVMAVLSTIVPMAWVTLRLKYLRAETLLPNADLAERFNFIRSDLAFIAGYSLFWMCALAACSLLRPRVERSVAIVMVAVSSLSAVVLMGIVFAADQYWKVTRLSLDLERLRFSVSELGSLSEVLLNEVTPGMIPGAVLLGVLMLAMPWLVRWGVARRWRHGRAPRRWTLIALPLATGLIWLSWLPNAAAANPEVARNAVVEMVGKQIRRDVAAARFHRTPDRTGLDAASITLESTWRTQRRNVVLIHLESVRASATTVYNPDLATTPFMAEMAETSTVVQHAYTTTPHTSKALVSVNCGIDPPIGMDLREARPEGLPSRCLAELLGERGYDSALFQSAVGKFENRKGLAGNFGYEDVYTLEDLSRAGFAVANYFGYEDDIMLPASETWLRERGGRPFVASYVTVVPHHDYKVPATFPTTTYASDKHFNDYLNTVSYVDRFVERLIDQYKDLGLYDDTVFVLYGDHGEGFGEHGRFQHDATPYVEGTYVPLIIHDPQHPGGRVESGPASLTDVVPTVLDRLGYGIMGGSYAGVPVDQIEPGRTVNTLCYQTFYCMSSVKDGIAYIDHFDQRPAEVYDLRTDPLQLHDLAATWTPEQLRERREALLAYRARIIARYDQ